MERSHRRAQVSRRDLPIQILARLPIEIVKFADREACSRMAMRAYRLNGIRYRPDAWFKHPLSACDRRAISRATRQLDETGMVVRLTESKRDRVLFVRLTAMGLRCAMEQARDLDVDALIRSLRRTWWGRELVSVPTEEQVAFDRPFVAPRGCLPLSGIKAKVEHRWWSGSLSEFHSDMFGLGGASDARS